MEWRISPVIYDIHLLMGSFPSCRFQFVKRQANSVARNVAHWTAQEMVIGNVPTSCIPVLCLSSDNPWLISTMIVHL